MPLNGTGYYVVMPDNNTKSGNIDSHSEFQNGRQVLNNNRLNCLHHNEGLICQNMTEIVIFIGFNDSHFEFRVNQES